MAENGKISISRQRWKLLAQVITRQPDYLSDPENNSVSVRRFNNFGLLEVRVHEDGISKDSNSVWLEYSSKDFADISCVIRQLQGNVTLDTLLGFNNTGNVCVWPSEEVMAYYCLKHREDFRSKVVCEVGGGMTCLAGVFTAVCTEAAEVVLTDGNEESVNNLTYTVARNQQSVGSTKCSARLLRWGPDLNMPELESKFDSILCADCLFFDEGREHLVNMLSLMLKPGGQALMFAPTRGNTFHEFTKLALKTFELEVKKNYDDIVWNLHQKFLSQGNDVYVENLHYPVMLVLTKPMP
ncbi:calmodulin-lysine N-methyltransferase-like [Liolophura sinensis]|uniref:calmodulin-lysine N-methyltransferase-like n=1 Tax=Liolophura sinensis TaxID=3198878 RepID=UPI003158F9C0